MKRILWVMALLGLSAGIAASPRSLQQPEAPAAASAPANAKIWVGRYAEFEEFLRTAEIERTTTVSTGILGIRRAYFKPGGPAVSGAFRIIRPGRYDGFFESYRSEIAAYKLDRLLELDMVPPTVERRYERDTGSLQLWVSNTRMLKEIEEQKQALPGAVPAFQKQLYRQRVFDDLIANIDVNKGNLLFDSAWNIILIDHSRAFTGSMVQPFPLTRIDRPYLEKVKALERDTLRRELGAFVEGGAIEALLQRRDAIVRTFERFIKEKGEASVFVD